MRVKAVVFREAGGRYFWLAPKAFGVLVTFSSKEKVTEKEVIVVPKNSARTILISKLIKSTMAKL
jgi:hypothetical protein